MISNSSIIRLKAQTRSRSVDYGHRSVDVGLDVFAEDRRWHRIGVDLGILIADGFKQLGDDDDGGVVNHHEIVAVVPSCWATFSWRCAHRSRGSSALVAAGRRGQWRLLRRAGKMALRLNNGSVCYFVLG